MYQGYAKNGSILVRLESQLMLEIMLVSQLYMKLLLDAGASINDRGGPECLGVTPLHDAAAAGNLEVVELLLDRGAAALANTDDGNTQLFELQKWYQRINGRLEG